MNSKQINLSNVVYRPVDGCDITVYRFRSPHFDSLAHSFVFAETTKGKMMLPKDRVHLTLLSGIQCTLLQYTVVHDMVVKELEKELKV